MLTKQSNISHRHTDDFCFGEQNVISRHQVKWYLETEEKVRNTLFIKSPRYITSSLHGMYGICHATTTSGEFMESAVCLYPHLA